MTDPDPAERDDLGAPPRARLRDRWAARGERTAVAVLVGVVLGLAGAWAGAALAGGSSSHIGPLTVSSRLSLGTGGTTIHLPPLGSVHLPTHRGPLTLDATVESVDLGQGRRWLTRATDEAAVAELEDQARTAARDAALRTALAALAGGVLLAWLVTRRRASVVAGAVAVCAVLVGSASATALTFDPLALRQPSFTGTLVNAPKVVGNLAAIPENLNRYGTELAGLVDNVALLSRTLQDLPAGPDRADTVVVVHISDVHLALQAWPLVKQVVATYGADAVIDTGDIADHGTAAENAAFAPVADLGVPYLYVKGNHDSAVTVTALRALPNVTVLDDDTATVAGITFAGAPDPRFTPDKTTRDDGPAGTTAVVVAAETLRDFVSTFDATHPAHRVDVIAFHDPHAVGVLDGAAPTLLFGHMHVRSTWKGAQGSRIFVQGSTGGAGLRAIEGEDPTPVTLTVLYVSRSDGEVTAFDDITLGGLGTTSAQVTRHTVAPDGSTNTDSVPTYLNSAPTVGVGAADPEAP